jgi:hypothetical protein
MEGASPIYGNSRARWARDGHYFDRNGREVSAAEAVLPEFEDEPAPVAAEETVPSYQYGKPPAPTESIVITESVRSELLAGMNAQAIAKLVRVAGGHPARGPGSREQNERWLLENTTD